MRPRSRFLIGFAAAALTFGTLMAILGPQRFGAHCANHGHHGYCNSPYDQTHHTAGKAN